MILSVIRTLILFWIVFLQSARTQAQNDLVSVKERGAAGGGAVATISDDAPFGSITIKLLGLVPVSPGEIAVGDSLSSGTRVAGFTRDGDNMLVRLSIPSKQAIHRGQTIGFAYQDDVSSFEATSNSVAAAGGGVVLVPGSTYYLSHYITPRPGVSWLLAGASFLPGGGIGEAINQGMLQEPKGPAIAVLHQMAVPSQQEESLLITAANSRLGSLDSYQKSAVHLQILQADPSCYDFLGDACGPHGTHVGDIVGLSVQGSCAPGNMRCSLFGGQFLLRRQKGTDGPVAAFEFSLENDTGIDVPEQGSWNSDGALDLISSGDTPNTTALDVQAINPSGRWYDGITIHRSAVIRSAWALMDSMPRDDKGRSDGHVDFARLGVDGSLFAQRLHIVSGPSVNGEDRKGGAILSGEANGRLVLGDSTLRGHLPAVVEFHPAFGGTQDIASWRFVATKDRLSLVDRNGKTVASWSQSNPDQASDK